MPIPVEQLENFIKVIDATGENPAGFQKAREAVEWLAGTEHGEAQLLQARKAAVKQVMREEFESRSQAAGGKLTLSDAKAQMWEIRARGESWAQPVRVMLEGSNELRTVPDLGLIYVPANEAYQGTRVYDQAGREIKATLASDISAELEKLAQPHTHPTTAVTQQYRENLNSAATEVYNNALNHDGLIDSLNAPSAYHATAEAILRGDHTAAREVLETSMSDGFAEMRRRIYESVGTVNEAAQQDPAIREYAERHLKPSMIAQNKVLEMQGLPPRGMGNIHPDTYQWGPEADVISFIEKQRGDLLPKAGLIVEHMDARLKAMQLAGGNPTAEELAQSFTAIKQPSTVSRMHEATVSNGELGNFAVFHGDMQSEGGRRVEESLNNLLSTPEGQAQFERSRETGIRRGMKAVLAEAQDARQHLYDVAQADPAHPLHGTLTPKLSISEIKKIRNDLGRESIQRGYDRVAVAVGDGMDFKYNAVTHAISVPAEVERQSSTYLTADGIRFESPLQSGLAHELEHAGQRALTLNLSGAYEARFAQLRDTIQQRKFLELQGHPEVLAHEDATMRALADAVLRNDADAASRVARESSTWMSDRYLAMLHDASMELISATNEDPIIQRYYRRLEIPAIIAENDNILRNGISNQRALDYIGSDTLEMANKANVDAAEVMNGNLEAAHHATISSMQQHIADFKSRGKTPTVDELLAVAEPDRYGPKKPAPAASSTGRSYSSRYSSSNTASKTGTAAKTPEAGAETSWVERLSDEEKAAVGVTAAVGGLSAANWASRLKSGKGKDGIELS